jgi:succinate dehydrogenase / fumarate reductase flavoprotein subunit
MDAEVHEHDILIVGSGGAGLQAALTATQESDADVAVVSKLYPTRSHTCAAQGGIGAALGNEEEDSWEWHAYDTIKGSDYLGDQDRIELLCKKAPEAVIELEHLGVPFSRTEEGKIAQRRFGGHTRDFGDEPVRRSCYAADRTGHMILHTLHDQCLKHDINFYTEYHVIELINEDDEVKGVVAYDLSDGSLHVFKAQATMFATGGFGQIFSVTSNAVTSTGDGYAMALNAGVPLEDMEFVQFHPTGLRRLGILMSEAARGEGGILRNDNGERFMEEYAPSVKDLAPRDMVSQAIYTEVNEGRGIDGEDYVYLDLTHLGEEKIREKLPDIAHFAETYLGVDPVNEGVPVQPTCHYSMGGIPTDEHGKVLHDDQENWTKRFFAAGEAACVSIHGANRLGTNALVELVVMGRQTGKAMADFVDENTDVYPEINGDHAQKQIDRLTTLRERDGSETVAELRENLQEEMMENVGVYRTEEKMANAIETIDELQERYEHVAIDDAGKHFNYDLMDAVELGNLLKVARSVAVGAKARKESRGAHSRPDYEERNDEEWLKHTLAYQTQDDDIELDYKSVNITKHEPKERTY